MSSDEVSTTLTPNEDDIISTENAEASPLFPAATMSPVEYRKRGVFVRDYRSFLVREGLVVFLVLLLIPLCVPVQPPDMERYHGWVGALHVVLDYAAVVIFALVYWAVRAAHRALAEIGVNRAIADTVARRCEKELVALRSGNATRPEVHNLAARIVPDNNSQPGLAMTRLFHRVCSEAQDRRFESSLSLIEPYQREAYDAIGGLERLQKVALRLGILGTFVGLMFALGQVPLMIREFGGISSSMLGSNTSSELVATGFITEILNALRLAFGTSIAGLGVAVLASCLSQEVRKHLNGYLQRMEAATVSLVSLALNSYNNDELHAELRQLQAALHDLQGRLHDQSQKIDSGLTQVAKAITTQANELDKGMERIRNAGTEFRQRLDEIVTAHARFLQDLKAHYEVTAVKEIADRVTGELEAQTNTLHREIHTMSEPLQEIADRTTRIARQSPSIAATEPPSFWTNTLAITTGALIAVVIVAIVRGLF